MQLLTTLQSVEQFRSSSDLVAWFNNFSSSQEGKIFLGVLRNYCLRVVPTLPVTAENSSFELGRAFGRTELLSVLLSCGEAIAPLTQIEPTYEPSSVQPEE